MDETSRETDVSSESSELSRALTASRSSEGKEWLLSLRTSWLTCFCVVTFDVDIGPKIEEVCPPLALNPADVANICFSAFPDSNSHLTGDMLFSFRHRAAAPPTAAAAAPPAAASGGAEAAAAAAGADVRQPQQPQQWAVLESDASGFYFGHVFFRQQRDASVQRGYLQKALVVLTPHGWLGLYKALLSLLAPLYFEAGPAALESTLAAVVHSWPEPPRPGTRHELPLLGSVLTFDLPQLHFAAASAFSAPASAVGPAGQLLSSLQPLDPYGSLRPVLSQLWLLWELMLLAQPLLLLASSPAQASDAVMSLVSLIAPLQYGGDYRPYLTIQDADFKRLSGKQVQPAAVVGVTNPFLLQAFGHWPNLVCLDSPSTASLPAPAPAPSSSSSSSSSSATGSVLSASPGALGRSPVPLRAAKLQGVDVSAAGVKTRYVPCLGPVGRDHVLRLLLRSAPLPAAAAAGVTAAGPAAAAAAGAGTGLLLAAPTAVSASAAATGCTSPSSSWAASFSSVGRSTRTPSPGPELAAARHQQQQQQQQHQLLNAPSVDVATDADADGWLVHNNTVLREHFLELSHKFLVPLERYFATLMPFSKDISAFHKPPRLKSFNSEEFLESLSDQKPMLAATAAREIELYRRFLRSPNFTCWFDVRLREATQKLSDTYVQVLLDADMAEVARHAERSEPISEIYLNISQVLANAEGLSAETIASLQKQRASLAAHFPHMRETGFKSYVVSSFKP